MQVIYHKFVKQKQESNLRLTTLNENTVMYITLLFLNLLTVQLEEKCNVERKRKRVSAKIRFGFFSLIYNKSYSLKWTLEKQVPDGWLRRKIPRAAPNVTRNLSSVPERNPPAALNPAHIPERTRKSLSGRDEIKISAKIWFLLLEIAFLRVQTHFYLRVNPERFTW